MMLFETHFSGYEKNFLENKIALAFDNPFWDVYVVAFQS